jgi:SAM-dependent methyltransferase
MFRNFPKRRPELPPEFQAIYKKHYEINRQGDSTATGLAQKMETWLHRKVAADVDAGNPKPTLEIGAGTLNQLQYEESGRYDIVEPFKELYQTSPLLNKVNQIYADIDEIDLSNRYDRITSIATFEHITDLPKVVAKTCLLLNEGGCLRTSIPNEGRFLWTLGWKLTTAIEFKAKYGLDYSVLMKYEHINTADEIEEILNYFYAQNKRSMFGVGKTFSFYRFYESRKPNVDLARKYLKSITP